MSLPLFTFDILIADSVGGRPLSDDDIKPSLLRGKVFMLLHGAFSKFNPDQPTVPKRYAIALRNDLPRSPDLRVFAEYSSLLKLREHILNHHVIRDYTRVCEARPVPQEFEGGWTSYRRYRIPTVKQDRNAENGCSLLHDRRQKEAERMPAIYVRSSGGSSWLMPIQMVRVTKPSVDGSMFAPNGYGLATTERPFALPDLPWLE
jgi:hypothetical protein